MSFHYWRNSGKPHKTKFISLQNSYHGETLGALGVTDVAIFKDTYAPLLMQSAQMPSPDFRLSEAGEGAEAFALRCADALAFYVSEHHAELAAFIIEPLVQCAAGMGMYHPAYLRRAREICSQYDVHLIADEIAVGFGRSGTMFACEQAGLPFDKLRANGVSNLSIKNSVRPELVEGQNSLNLVSDIADFICLSKGITGGYLPLSAVLTTDKVYKAFYDDSTLKGFLHSHSYTGNPLACSAALATLAIFESDNVIETNKDKAAYLNGQMQVLTDLPIEHVRHQGMILAFDVQTDDSKTTHAKFSRDCYSAALKQGLLLRPIGNTVYFMPPYTITEPEIDLMMHATLQAIKHSL
jgi:adenosylmethionine-8-amino-7-oxononanoate aminotransferase